MRWREKNGEEVFISILILSIVYTEDDAFEFMPENIQELSDFLQSDSCSNLKVEFCKHMS